MTQRSVLISIIPRDISRSNRLPLVIFNNGVGAMDIPTWGQYKEWCRLIAASGMIAIIHQARPGEGFKRWRSIIGLPAHSWSRNWVLIRRGSDYGPVAPTVVQDQGSHFKTRPKKIKALVMYYAVTDSLGTLRQDLPTFLVRAGLDAQSLNSTLIVSCNPVSSRTSVLNSSIT